MLIIRRHVMLGTKANNLPPRVSTSVGIPAQKYGGLFTRIAFDHHAPATPSNT